MNAVTTLAARARCRRARAMHCCLFVLALLAALAPPAAAQEPDNQRSRRISVREPAGLERRAWPIVAGVAVPAAEAAGDAPAVRLVRETPAGGEEPVAVQVLGWLGPTQQPVDPARPKVRLVEICFLADLPANETVHFRAYIGEPGNAGDAATAHTAPTTVPADAAAAGDVAVPQLPVSELRYSAGEGMGVTIDTGAAIFAFDPRSGQLLSYDPKLTGDDAPGPLTFVQGRPLPIHWNPDVWAPPEPWGHVSDWDFSDESLRPEFLATQGPIAYRSVRRGVMPTSNGVTASVTYTVFAGMPFILESSVMEFTQDTQVHAVRNNELVFNRGQHTHGAWLDEAGEFHEWLGYDEAEPTHFRGWHGPIPPDVPWIGLFHAGRRHGIGVVHRGRFTGALASLLGPQNQQAHYYFLDYGEHGTGENYHLNFMYLSRSEVHGPTVVPKGAVFAEESAFLAFRLGEGDDKFEDVRRWTRLLRQPPVVTVAR